MNKPSHRKKKTAAPHRRKHLGRIPENHFFSYKAFQKNTSSGRNEHGHLDLLLLCVPNGGYPTYPRSHCPNHFVLDRILAFRWSFECGYYRVPNQLGASVAGCVVFLPCVCMEDSFFCEKKSVEFSYVFFWGWG